MILYFEGDTQALEEDAKGVLSLLWNCYPGHPWSVTCKPGIIFIRHMDFGSNWGMNIKVTKFDYDAAVLKKKIIMLAGEWLERANIKRGRLDADQETVRVEGVPEKFQPVKSNADPVPTGELRTEARPQVLK
jgi:hypothetical protein